MHTTITLRPMTDSEFKRVQEAIFEDYARDLANVNSTPIEEGRKAAARQSAMLLPDGMATQGHYFWRIVNENGTAVGDLWVQVESEKARAFIWFIGIDEQHRGQGYSRAAMLALESAVKPLGAHHVDLNVFGDNTVAVRLYESLGYKPTAMNMRKEV
ncbi:MAG TPA: GNAT family N-acetyltransferase [Ktedonobacterales bacterium]|jgi:ribosomal protein S18 acetylase RimI-like enzyme